MHKGGCPMVVYSDSRKIMLLLNYVSSNKDQLTEIALVEIKQTDEFKLLKSLNEYFFLSKEAKNIRVELQQISFENKEMEGIYEEFDKLKEIIYQKFTPLLNSSKSKVGRGSYKSLGIIDFKTYQNALDKNDIFAKFLKILIKSNQDSPVDAFRNYLKSRSDKDVMNEYIQLRNKEIRLKDYKRQDYFNIFGAIGGFVASPFIFQSFTSNLLFLKIFWVCYILVLIFGLFSNFAYLNLISLGATFTGTVGMILLTILQTSNHLPANFLLKNLYQIINLTSLALSGGLIGILVSNLLNKLPKVPFELPEKLGTIHKYTLVFTIFFLAYGSIWTHAFSKQQTIYQLTFEKINQKLVTYEKEQQLEQDKKALVMKRTNQPLGTIVVKMDANIRYGPSLKAKKFDVVSKGTKLQYYGTSVDSRNIKWYKLKIENSNKFSWISESTVNVVK